MTAPNSNNLQSLSISSCLNNIIAFFNSQDNNSNWKSLTSSSEGSFLIRLLAIVTSNISYKVVSYVREVFLNTCNILSSAIGISVNLGYSVYRGSNQRRLISIIPSRDVTIPKYSVIGQYNADYDILVVENYNLSKNTPIDVQTVIGKIKTVSQAIGTADLKIFSFYTNDISEDIILLKDGLEMPFSKNPRDMANDVYWVRTNPFSSVDIQYLNNASGAKYTYSSGSIFSIRYIELADVPSIPYTDNMLFITDPISHTPIFYANQGIVTRTILQYIPFESVNSIKVTAPYYHETQNLIRSKKDYPKKLPDINTSILTSDYNIVVPTYATVTYIKNNYSLLSTQELSDIYTKLDNERFLGTPLPDITAPKRELITLNISFKFTNKFINLADVRNDVQSLLEANYYNKLNNSFSTFDLEELFTKYLDYVRYARVEVVSNLRVNSAYYNLGDVVNYNSISYKATGVTGLSGNTEPSWNLPLSIPKEIDTKLETLDNDIIWKAYKRLNLDYTQISEWAPNTSYKIGDYVYPSNHPYYMFKVVDLAKYSDPTLSTIPEGFSSASINSFVEDGDILWVGKIFNDSDPERESGAQYRLGDNIRVGSMSYECVGYRGKSDSTAPIFEQDIYTITSKGLDYFEIVGDYSKYFTINDILKVFVSNSLYYSFSVQNVNYTNSTGKTRIDVNQTVNLNLNYTTLTKRNVGTTDGTIFWEIVTDVTENVSKWDVYNTMNFNLIAL